MQRGRLCIVKSYEKYQPRVGSKVFTIGNGESFDVPQIDR